MILLACAPDPLVIAASRSAAGVVVETSAPVDAVEVLGEDGAVLVRRTLARPGDTVDLAAPLAPGRYRVRVHAGAREAEADVEIRAPAAVEVQPSPGSRWVRAEGDVPVPVFSGVEAEVLVREAGAVRTLRVAREPVELDGYRLVPRPIDPAALSVVSLAFPADALGLPDLGRPTGRISVPARAWEELVRWTGLGGRRRDGWAPWAWQGVTLANAQAEAIDVAVSLEILRDGVRPPAFRPHARTQDGDTGTVSVLLRVPGKGRATAALPVFADLALVEEGPVEATLVVTPLGGGTPLLTRTSTLYVTRGDTLASAGFATACFVWAAGVAWCVPRLRGWLDAAATSELMTIALTGSALFLVGTATDLVTMGIGAVLGPFASVATGLLSDVGRVVLLGTLVSLLPRPGVLTLATLTGWFLRGFSTGSFSPVDVLYYGFAIAMSESLAWISGITRGTAWREESEGRRWLRLAVAFGGASVATSLAGLWIHVVLFRLFFAGWYVAMQVLIPGLLYPVIACRIAASFADSLRRVAP